MSSAQKIIQAAAGNAAGEALYVEDVFSTYLYEGNGSTQTITNDIDLDGEGGLVWIKTRGTDTNFSHLLQDTERGAGKVITSNTTDAEVTNSGFISSFNSDGFSIGSIQTINKSGNDLASWTFRKAPKFFDVVTYTGTGSARTIAHNLGSVPGCIIVKAVSGAALGGVSDWTVYHRGVDATNPEQYRLYLNTTGARVDQTNPWNDTAPTSTEFTVGTDSYLNANGDNYVAYLFAHNDDEGEFGEDADQDIIKCGSYTGNGSTDGPEIDLGFEPQWLLIKNATTSGYSWTMLDTMRGIVTGGDDKFFRADTSDAEGTFGILRVTATGFKLDTTNGSTNRSGDTFIYIAIRRGPMKTPEDATEVFATTKGDVDTDTNFVVDLNLSTKTTSYSNYAISRLTGIGNYLITNGTDAESSTGLSSGYDKLGIDLTAFHGASADLVYWNFRRAPGFFDVVAYEGNGTAGRTVSHNLGVVPEMMIVKRRDSSFAWYVYHEENTAEPETDFLVLNETNATSDNSSVWNDTAPTNSVFSLGTGFAVNQSSGTYIAYLFATVPGVSKVGGYTGNGTSQTIDCGFSAGARFVLIKRTDSTGDWHVYDSERGIVAGNDPRLELNTTDAEDTGSDDIDPVSSGFSVTSNADVNTNSASYVFLAIS